MIGHNKPTPSHPPAQPAQPTAPYVRTAVHHPLHINGYMSIAIYERLYINRYISTAIYQLLHINCYVSTAMHQPLDTNFGERVYIYTLRRIPRYFLSSSLTRPPPRDRCAASFATRLSAVETDTKFARRGRSSTARMAYAHQRNTDTAHTLHTRTHSQWRK